MREAVLAMVRLFVALREGKKLGLQGGRAVCGQSRKALAAKAQSPALWLELRGSSPLDPGQAEAARLARLSGHLAFMRGQYVRDVLGQLQGRKRRANWPYGRDYFLLDGAKGPVGMIGYGRTAL